MVLLTCFNLTVRSREERVI